MRKFLAALAATSAILAVPARASVVLKGTTGESGFRVKTVRAQTVIENGVATTSLVWTFAESQRRWKPEVEFFYAAPPRGVVTFFAYWFKGERVVARAVEKEKAASIYAQLSSWGVDPALIELDGKNTFRARIFPVEANQDVRVEMHLIQPLEATPDGQKWSLPLLQKFVAPRRLSKYLPVSKADAPFYDRVQIEVETREKGRVGFPGARFSGGKWRLDTKNLAADRDFSLSLPRPTVPLRADLFSSRASGQNGYFSLLLTPSQALKKPRLKFAGVAVSDVFPKVIPALKAGENLLVCGRYRGAGAATVSLSGGPTSVAQRVIFSAQRGANNPATKLWASRQIAALGASEANRSRVIAFSKRWNLPSAQTSWLAVPTVEKRNFEATKKQAETQKLARQVVSDLILGRTASAKANRAKLESLYDPKRNPWSGSQRAFAENWINGATLDVVQDLARAVVSEELEDRPNARQQSILQGQLNAALALKTRLAPDEVKLEGYMLSARNDVAQKRSQQIAPEYVEAVLGEGEDSPRARALKKQFDRLQPLFYAEDNQYHPVQGAFYARLRVPLHQLSYQKQLEAARLNPDPAKIAAIDADLNRLLERAGVKRQRRDEFLAWQSTPAWRDATHELFDEYAAEIQKPAGNSDKIRALYARIGELVEKQKPRFAGATPVPGDPLYEQYIRPYDQNPLDAPEIKAAQKSGDKRELLAQIDRKRQFFARPGDPLIEVNAPADCQQVVAILPPGEIKKLVYNRVSQMWEVRFDVPTYAVQNLYRIQILIVGKTGTRRRLALDFRVDTSGPGARARLESRDGQTHLRVETEAQTDRVSAFTPWNQRVEMRRDENGIFYAQVTVPSEFQSQNAKMHFVLTDKAHNRTEIWVDWK